MPTIFIVGSLLLRLALTAFHLWTVAIIYRDNGLLPAMLGFILPLLAEIYQIGASIYFGIDVTYRYAALAIFGLYMVLVLLGKKVANDS